MKLRCLLIVFWCLVVASAMVFVQWQGAREEIIQKDIQSNLVEQPAKPTIYIVDESAVFEKDGYLYYEIEGDSDGKNN